MRVAFKDWVIVVDALERGEQILILRKGGIAEGRGGFQVGHDEFLLFPTLYHQQREAVVPAAQARYDAIAAQFPPPGILRLSCFARLADWCEVRSLEHAHRLRDGHIWRDEVIAERFEWGREQKIFALALRVFRLPEPVELPLRPEYGGCKSWIELAEDVDVSGGRAVLGEEEFARRLEHLRELLR